jgi:hypothetical protein
MTAIIYHFGRAAEASPADETERLFAALGRYTTAELLELLYVGEEPGFFDLIRGIFGLSDEARLLLQNFLASGTPKKITAEIDQKSGGALTLRASERDNPLNGIPH